MGNYNNNNNNSCFVFQYFDKGTSTDHDQSTSTSSDYFNTLFFNHNNMIKIMNMKMKMISEYMDLSNIFSKVREDGNGRIYLKWRYDCLKTYYHIKLISSCRGFLLFTAKPAPHPKVHFLFRCCLKPMDEESPALILYNPVTKEQLTVIAPPSKYVYCGFYYHSPTKLHKILYRLHHQPDQAAAAAGHGHGGGFVRFLVLCFEKVNWEPVDVMYNNSTDHYGFRYDHCLPDPSTPPVISNGSLHWIVSEDDDLIHDGQPAAHDHHLQIPLCSHTIMSFGMESEKFRWMPHPTLSHPCSGRDSNGHRHHMNLLEMEGGVLCLCDGYGVSDPILEIYVMEDYEKWTWVRRYFIDLTEYIIDRDCEYGLHYKALQILQGDQLLLHVHHPNSLNEEYEEDRCPGTINRMYLHRY